MSNVTALHYRLGKWSDAKEKELGGGWRELELGWSANQIIQQYVRECGYFYSSLDDFERWLDDYFEESIRMILKGK